MDEATSPEQPVADEATSPFLEFRQKDLHFDIGLLNRHWHSLSISTKLPTHRGSPIPLLAKPRFKLIHREGGHGQGIRTLYSCSRLSS